MKATRILLLMSPLLWFVPPLIPMAQVPLGLQMLNMFYKGLLGRFPENAIMAYLCYTYADQLGRESWYWVILSLFFPYLTPFVLAFVPPKYGSTADEMSRVGKRPPQAKAAAGAFDARFPLLDAYLANVPEATRTEARARMDRVPANFEFSVFAGPNCLDALLAGAAARALTVWTSAENGGMRVFGAGLVEDRALPEVTAWLLAAAPERKAATAVHPAEGPPKYFEYYRAAN
ncbi:MAG TPA: hypothetical protein VGE89_05300 [Bryobacteraceae bacterium]|jgi:hypothetical protein